MDVTNKLRFQETQINELQAEVVDLKRRLGDIENNKTDNSMEL